MLTLREGQASDKKNPIHKQSHKITTTKITSSLTLELNLVLKISVYI